MPVSKELKRQIQILNRIRSILQKNGLDTVFEAKTRKRYVVIPAASKIVNDVFLGDFNDWREILTNYKNNYGVRR